MATLAMDARRVAVIVVFLLVVALAAVWRLATADHDRATAGAPRMLECEIGIVSVTWPMDGERVGCLEDLEEMVLAAATRSRCELPRDSSAKLFPRLRPGERLEVSTDRGRCLFSVSSLSGWERVALGVPIDLNSAEEADLVALNGIGPVLAQRIVSYREERGPFGSVEELSRVRGIGTQRLARLSPYLVAETPEHGSP